MKLLTLCLLVFSWISGGAVAGDQLPSGTYSVTGTSGAATFVATDTHIAWDSDADGTVGTYYWNEETGRYESDGGKKLSFKKRPGLNTGYTMSILCGMMGQFAVANQISEDITSTL